MGRVRFLYLGGNVASNRPRADHIPRRYKHYPSRVVQNSSHLVRDWHRSSRGTGRMSVLSVSKLGMAGSLLSEVLAMSGAMIVSTMISERTRFGIAG